MTMRTLLAVAVLAGLAAAAPAAETATPATPAAAPTPPPADLFAKDTILAKMRQVADWQLANMPKEFVYPNGKKQKMSNDAWIRAALFTGIMATHQVTQDAKYFDAMMKVSEGNAWKPGPRRHADDHCVGQTYCELFMAKKDPKMLEALRATFDKYIADPKPGRDEWWWCDALFMAPPALARLAAVAGEKKYLDYMNTMWWDCTEFLYDKEEHLYFRDKSYFGKTEKNGKKIFWSRGNGWVLAGTARVLQVMPPDYPDRPKYIQLFKDMAAKVASLQQADGLWRASLLDPESYPGGETSGSGFFTFGMAWGINNGLLEREKYLPVVKKGWTALVGCVDDAGKLGWVQPVGAAPAGGITKEFTMDYGVGAFLLAGSEVLKLEKP